MSIAIALLSFLAGYLGGRLMLRRTNRSPPRHEWAAFGQGGNVNAASTFRPHLGGGQAYGPPTRLSPETSGRIYLQSRS